MSPKRAFVLALPLMQGRRAEATFGARGLYRGTHDGDTFALDVP